MDASPVQPFGNINVTDVITTESLPGDSEPCNIVANSKAGSHSSAKKTRVCASPSFFITALLIQVILGKHPTVQVQALSSPDGGTPPPSPEAQTFI